MDISYWTNINYHVTFNKVHKQYYDKYVWKLVLTVSGGRLIYSTSADLQADLEHRRKHVERFVNWGGSWAAASQRLGKLHDADVELLATIREYRNDSTCSLKFRVEEPLVQVYAKTEAELKHFANHLGLKYQHVVQEVHGVTDLPHHEALINGAIVTKQAMSWSHKIIFRDTFIDIKCADRLLDYFNSLGSDVKVSKSIIKQLTPSSYSVYRNGSYVWGGFLYCNDPGVAVFLSLIAPNLVKRIHSLVLET